MKLDVAFWDRQAPNSYTYLLTPGGTVPAQGRWFGVFLHTPAPQDTARLAYLSHILQTLQNPMLYHSLSFLFVEAGGTGGRDIAGLGAALLARGWGPDGTAGFHWLPDAATLASTASLPMIPLVDRRRARYGVLLDAPETRPLVVLDEGAQAASVRLAGPRGKAIMVEATAADDGFSLTCEGAVGLVRATGRGSPGAPFFATTTTGAAIEIPAAGPWAGCLQADGALATPVSELVLGLRYELTAPGAPELSGPLACPAMTAPDGLAGQAARLSLSPGDPLDPARSALTLDPGGPGFVSAFRTRTGTPIALAPAPDEPGRLVFNRGNGAVRYLTLDGSFAASLPGGAEAGEFLCGLSGVEYVAFRAGDRFVFSAGRPATAGVTLAQGAPAFETDADGAATTAWMTIRDAQGTASRAYVAAPDHAPFFAAAPGGPDPMQLGFLPLGRIALAPGDAAPFFPVLPYAAMTATGTPAETICAFEFSYLNPLRRAAIAKAAAAQDGAAEAGTTHALTPQGHKATFRDGRWIALDIAAMSGPGTDVAIRFEAPDGEALPGPLQDAFLTNQQFLVITRDNGNLGRFRPRITMSGWRFDLDLSQNTAAGSYRNVLIFKAANASLAQLAAQPRLWTGVAAFTADDDPEGAYLSAWLTAYLDEARRLYDGGRGVAALGAFCRLIDDPDWNGVLALNVSVDPGNLAPEIEALLAGVDQSLFAAHHIGNRVNHVAPAADGDLRIASSVFGLIHYTDPADTSGRGEIAYLATPDDYDFRVLTLEAVFENAALAHFSNRSLLVANRLFGDRVLDKAPEGQEARNALTLIGTYRQTDGVPSYTFATAPGTAGTFLLGGNALSAVTVTRTTMSVSPETAGAGGAGGGYVARFGLWGHLGFRERPDFDLLSFERLGFGNLALEMRLAPVAAQAPGQGTDFARSFSFRTGGMVFGDAPLRQIGQGETPPPGTEANLVRAGSLLTAFPLKVKGLVGGNAATPPDSLGYRVLTTTEPAGFRPADLSGGDWHGLAFEMTLGAKGALAGKAVIAADLVLAWRPGGADGPDIAPLFRLSGPEGISLAFDIEGVVRFGARDVALNRIRRIADSPAPDMFVMIFESIGLSVLTLSFPPAGTTNVYLMGGLGADKKGGEVTPTLGWIGGYKAREAKS
ncbi:hypothetical protein [Rhodovulum euryhalinum]|uniref:Uncharacterized protein n=1 Tax=Rhodovulum euryhalinum TaxID=35805 RepID=A0A4R2KDI8_9RHOB|nr:hypothetical protein [Rhodovulum euryhalinum]TCO71651.1 hypothetical protein EV655_106143 [Rhodovulum euryhalinum]